MGIKEIKLLKTKTIFKSLIFQFYLVLYACLCYAAITGLWIDIIVYCLIILTIVSKCILILMSYWFVWIRVKIMYKKCDSISECDYLHVIPFENKGIEEILKYIEKDGSLYFIYQKTKYYYDSETQEFNLLKFPIDWKISKYLDWAGHSNESLEQYSEKYGDNGLEIQIPKFSKLFLERCTNPFFIFQFICVFLWMLYEYWMYPLFTALMLVVFESILVTEQMKNLKLIHSIGNKEFIIKVYRYRKWIQISTKKLVPGDIVSICNSTTLAADMILIKGTCIIDESMLTGESVPVNKEPLQFSHEDDVFDISKSKLHFLYSGTQIIQVTGKTDIPCKSNEFKKQTGCVAIVVRTSFYTEQGSLMRTILYGSQRMTANNKETLFFILFLLTFALAAAFYLLWYGLEDDSKSKYTLLLECAIIITNVVPPELPLQLSLAVNSSLVSLVKLGIYCTEPFRIPYSGKLDICCFDKTGTLTHLKPQIAGIITHDSVVAGSSIPIYDANKLSHLVIKILAACNSVSVINKKKIGDPLEIELMNFVKFNFVSESSVSSSQFKALGTIKILKKFHFYSELGRMSTIVSFSIEGIQKTVVLTKGAPEIIYNYLKPDQIPKQYTHIHELATYRGSRVLALAYKIMEGNICSSRIHSLTRESIESNLIFSGFVEINNAIKKETINSIFELRKLMKIRCIMITGDNIYTASYVAKKIGMFDNSKIFQICNVKHDYIVLREIATDSKKVEIDYKTLFGYLQQQKIELAISGPDFGRIQLEDLNPPIYLKLMSNVRVFSRTCPKQKEQILYFYKKNGFITLMCGDGTNDVGALKQAHVGVALLDGDEKETKVKPKFRNLVDEMNNDNTIVKLGDASIAAPFTSKVPNISTVSSIILQGRSTLTITLQMFKILAVNALLLAYSQSVLYLDGIKFSDTQSTFQAMLLIGCFLFITRVKPLKKPVPTDPPPSKFFTFPTVSIIFIQSLLHLISVVYINRICKSLSPMEPLPVNLDSTVDSPVSKEEIFVPSLIKSCTYILSTALQIITFSVNYKGYPYNQSLFENKPMFYSILFSSSLTVALLFNVYPDLNEYMELVHINNDVKLALLFTILANGFIGYISDRLVQYLFVNKNPKMTV
ncbi:hypothetical protein A3Q56_04744 [Intoshia linei]|uniref:P-type ATPase A domain-containing protein n=1 Tax=Intoshia linei TaxID=1819745 RepID=A0A177AZT5_9BILA|nr:hypothetical protein A3Q56_04744 [Intoshia linei]